MAIFQLWYKESKTSRKWKQSSLSMLDAAALEGQGELLKKQEGWEAVKVMPDGKNPNNESTSKAQAALKALCETEEESKSWKVFINGHDTGIIETNWEYANSYWAKVAVKKKATIELRIQHSKEHDHN